MRKIFKKLSVIVSCVIGILIISVYPAKAVVIMGDGMLGDFRGEFLYTFTDSANAAVSLTLTNTSPAVNGGYLTGFVFNNPGNRITGISFGSTDSDFNLLGAPDFDNGINASPFGQFDIGSSTSTNFQGGGNPNKGIAVGYTESFDFALTGIGLDELSEWSFVSELSQGKGAGEGHQFFVARFRGFNDGGSNKTPAEVIPEPASLLLLGFGLLGLLGLRKKNS